MRFLDGIGEIYKPVGAYKRGAAELTAFRALARESWQTTLDLVPEARNNKGSAGRYDNRAVIY